MLYALARGVRLVLLTSTSMPYLYRQLERTLISHKTHSHATAVIQSAMESANAKDMHSFHSVLGACSSNQVWQADLVKSLVDFPHGLCLVSGSGWAHTTDTTSGRRGPPSLGPLLSWYQRVSEGDSLSVVPGSAEAAPAVSTVLNDLILHVLDDVTFTIAWSGLTCCICLAKQASDSPAFCQYECTVVSKCMV